MQLTANNLVAKTSRVITAGVRGTSCNRGWLQLFTHIICGTFTVSCFILILVITLKMSRLTNQEDSRCHLTGCRVICNEAPYYGEFEDDIVLAVMAAEVNCEIVLLTLREAAFTNESLPQNWLARLRPVVAELGIVGGNLHHIPPNAFSAAFTRKVKLLFFEHVTLKSLNQYSFLGLASLENIFITGCVISDMQENILSVVSESLETITVVQSGHWDPTNLMGLSQSSILPSLTTVDLSNNNFNAILGNSSFVRLRSCKSLYLSSSKISFIGAGAFDNMMELVYLNLNNNLLTSIEPGLFHVMTSLETPRVRLNLIDNFWHCDCSDGELRRLISKSVLLVQPICYSPENLEGKTFYEFIKYCRDNEPKQIVSIDMQDTRADANKNAEAIIHSLTCEANTSPNFTQRLISPFNDYPCSVDVLNLSRHSSHQPSMIVDFYNTEQYFWIKPILIVIGENFTMIELDLTAIKGFGLIWYSNSCQNEVFCVNIVPDTIRLFNLNLENEYTFCPVLLTSRIVESEQCIAYASSNHKGISKQTRLIMYPLIAVGCLFFGALSLYMLIRKYPYLLKGSKRLVFVKHKTVDALVLPPKVPLRGVLGEGSLGNSTNLLNASESLHSDFMRSGSVRSNHSCAPSYISALQPTEDQLADWRVKHANEKFENIYATISTISPDTLASLSSANDQYYYSLDDSPIYSMIDQFDQKGEVKL